jgi:hypothetical protein
MIEQAKALVVEEIALDDLRPDPGLTYLSPRKVDSPSLPLARSPGL